MISRLAALLLLVGACLLAIGCGGYVIRGRVVEGEISAVSFVRPDDPRLGGPGLGNVAVQITRDPMRPNRETVASVVSGTDGELHVPLSAFGAGWMEEVWEIRAQRRGFQPALGILSLPQQKQNLHLLIMLTPGFGEDPRDRERDYMEQFERFK